MNYVIIPQPDYEEKVSIEKTEFVCYSPKQMRDKYPDEDYNIVGEIKRKGKKKKIGDLKLGDKTFFVSEPNTYSKILYKRSGYVCVGENQYISLLKGRLAFLLLFLLLLLGLAGVTTILIHLGIPSIPTIDPYNPLPDQDPYSEAMEDDESVKGVSDEGGGHVAMIYTLNATLDLSDGKISMSFKNPNESNHDAVLQMYIISGDSETLIAQSGLIKAGYSLSRLDKIEKSAILKEGRYKGKYKVIYYNPDTGERALVESDITDLEITVVQ